MKKILLLPSFIIAMPLTLLGASEVPKKVNSDVRVHKQEEKNKMTVHTDPSGLTYTVLKEGSGDKAADGKQVTVHYTGWLSDNGKRGKKFDSSVDRGRPFTFKLGQGQVIQGWDKGVRGMVVGEIRELVIPPALGYGSRGSGSAIPGGATLIFQVEVVGVAS